jgi:hypothetical protein
MMAMVDRAALIEEPGGRRLRPVIVGVHLGVLAVLVLGSGAVVGRAGDGREAAAREPQLRIPGPLHRYSECCAGSTDPSMEAY